jgi:tetratricopeptide (TPR) repeat protein
MQRALGLILLSAVVGLTLPVVGREPGKAVSKERLNERDRAWSQARELRTKGDFAGAIAAGELTLDIERELVGDDHPDHISTVAFLAECEEAREDWESARSRRTEVLNRAVKAHGEAHYRVADARLALQHLSRLRSMTAVERASLREATALNAQVLKLFAKGEYRAAEDPALTALKLREKLLGPDHPDTAHSVNNLAFSYQGQANYSAAEPLYQRALTIYEKALGPHHPFTARSLNNLAVMYKSQGNYAAAEPLYERALKICEKALGPDHPDTAASVNNLAVFYETQGNHTAAEPLYQRALQICERVLGPDHPDTASSLNNLGLLHKTKGK